MGLGKVGCLVLWGGGCNSRSWVQASSRLLGGVLAMVAEAAVQAPAPRTSGFAAPGLLPPRGKSVRGWVKPPTPQQVQNPAAGPWGVGMRRWEWGWEGGGWRRRADRTWWY